MKIGSLFSGIGGIELGLETFGHSVAWHCEVDSAASSVLSRHWPDTRNLGDITVVDWSTVESVDVLCGGFPCQDISFAGKGAGIVDGSRSGLWAEYVRAIRSLRPRVVFVENVAALLARGMGRVLGDLAAAGYDAQWSSVRASDVGAPHRRERIFIVATDAGSERRGARAGLCSGDARWNWWGLADDDSGEAATDAGRFSDERRRAIGQVASTTNSHEGQASERQRLRDSTSDRRSSVTNWGDYEFAVHRWEATHGDAPGPVDVRGRLAPEFVEWMMGFPTDWTAGLSRRDRLKCLGNAVVPQCAALAWSLLAPTPLEAAS